MATDNLSAACETLRRSHAAVIFLQSPDWRKVAVDEWFATCEHFMNTFAPVKPSRDGERFDSRFADHRRV